MYFALCIQTSLSSWIWHFSQPHINNSTPLLSQWDEALLTMSKGETARLEIEPEWAYGRKGLPDSKYPFLWQIVCFTLCMSCKYVFINECIFLPTEAVSLRYCIASLSSYAAAVIWWKNLVNFALITICSLTPALPEFHPMQSWFLRLSWWPWINQQMLSSMHYISRMEGKKEKVLKRPCCKDSS